MFNLNLIRRVKLSTFTPLIFKVNPLHSQLPFAIPNLNFTNSHQASYKTMSSINVQKRDTRTAPTYVQYRSLIPPLSADLHKGQGGRIAVLGGSSDYTGAPFFSGMGALRLGADLCHIICDEDSSLAIKSYSPDLIVHPFIKTRTTSDCEDESKRNAIWTQTYDNIESVLKRIHVLVVGPGLSRDDSMLQSAKYAIGKAKELSIPIVIDADGLFLIQNDPGLIQGYTKAVMTPNIVEFGRLCTAKGINSNNNNSEEPAVQRLSKAFGGVSIIQKGSVDTISDGNTLYVVNNEGGLKRSGGQGDILTGLIATSLAWGVAYQNDVWKHSHLVQNEDIFLIACFGGCVINRECSRVAFQKFNRSVQSSDVINEIGSTFTTFYDKTPPGATWSEAINL